MDRKQNDNDAEIMNLRLRVETAEEAYKKGVIEANKAKDVYIELQMKNFNLLQEVQRTQSEFLIKCLNFKSQQLVSAMAEIDKLKAQLPID